MGYISVLTYLNAGIGISSYYCVILKMVILHDEIKTIKNGVFVLLIKKEKNCFFSKNPKKYLKKQVGWVFKKTSFSQPWLSFNPFW